MKHIMTKETNKSRIIFMTLVSALLFCSLLVTASLSPLANSGPSANKLGTMGMWTAIGMALATYLLPLILYIVGLNVMKFVMAVFCGLGLLINSAILIVALTMGGFPILLGLCIATLIVNVMWYFVAFRSSSKLNHQKRFI
ncbi:DUF5391 family protein [Bacillus sp. GB_SG_008]|uniref:DUF5391 family protein n=1 Tax=Bacillus sp. GB_SG_008 TaxID=3454627 RepID=UPI003F85B05F